MTINYGALSALLAALFFGMSAPFSKLLLNNISPVMLAGLLYAGSWMGLSMITFVRKRFRDGHEHLYEAGLKRGDLPYLLGSIIAGGIAAPIFLIYGLWATEASTASLLLNTEGVLTTLLATFIFREHAGKRIWAAAILMLLASSVLAYGPSIGGWRFQPGAILVILSSLMWAIDNNLTRQLSHRDPFLISRYKGAAAGVVNITAAFMLKESFPESMTFASALALGAVGYGASLVLFIYALRHLGTSRTSTFFGASPFIGMVLSIIILGEMITPKLIIATLLMMIGLWLILREFHEHEHTHDALIHEHRHIHDEHHDHTHEGEFFEPHCHVHEHDLLTHSHAHVPDLHHYHRHEG